MAEIKYFTLEERLEMRGYIVLVTFERSLRGGDELRLLVVHPDGTGSAGPSLKPPFTLRDLVGLFYSRLPVRAQENKNNREFGAMAFAVIDAVKAMSGQEFCITLPEILKESEITEPQVN